MGSFGDLRKTEMRMEYEEGYRDGYLNPLKKLEFLRKTKFGVINSKIGGFLARREYRRLFNRLWISRGGRRK